MEKIFQVTTQDIDGASPKDPTACPVARAVQRTLGPGVEVEVDNSPDTRRYRLRVVSRSTGRFEHLVLSVGLSNRIGRYDQSGAMTPFEFRVK